MATALDTKVIPIIREALLKYGKQVGFSLAINQKYNPSSGKNEADPPDGEEGTDPPLQAGYAAKVTPPTPYRHNDIDGDAVKQGDAKCYLQADGLPFVPRPQMIVTIDGHQWTAVNVDPIYSGELVALWVLQLRQ